MSAKAGGQNGKHAPVNETSNISALSYLSVQLYSIAAAKQFSPSPKRVRHLGTKLFALLPPIQFLTILKTVPKSVDDGKLEVSNDDSRTFKQLKLATPKIDAALKAFAKRQKRSADAEDREDEE